MTLEYWQWFVLGFFLMAVELIAPGVFILWIGVGALATGACVFLMPSLTVDIQGFLFAGFSLLAIYVGRKYILPPQKEGEKASGLNQKGDKYIGETAVLLESVTHGRGGKVSLEGALWTVECKAKIDIPAGERVKIIARHGTRFTVTEA